MTETQLEDHWIDDVADRFEDAWCMGLRPRIEEYLNGVLEKGQAELLEELVCVDVHRRLKVSEAPSLEEYQDRFPDDVSVVEAGYRAGMAPGPDTEPEPVSEPIGSQMLLGMLALQHKLVDHDELLNAFKVWTDDKTRSLSEILVDQGDLTAVRLALLESYAAQTLKQYNGDVTKSLASRGALETIRDDLAKLQDAELTATLTGLACEATTVTDRGASTRERGRLGSQRFPGDRFRLIRRIDSGGQGDIFLAFDEALNRTVALKRIKERFAYSAELQARLLVEAEVAARLEHPAFLPVHFAGLDRKGRPYFVMRYIEGDCKFERKIDEFHALDSSARLPDERSQGLRQLLRHFVDVCYAVAYAHDRGVVHRDIKPANVLIGQFGETYLVDWGMVKFVERSGGLESPFDETLRPSPGHGTVLSVDGGTIPFMSPEQIARQTISFATDIYSLGVMLYALLTGKRPFVDKNKAQIEANIKSGRFKHPREVDSRAPAALEAVCLKAMKLRPADRYASAKEMARHVEDWLADRPIDVYREPLLQRARRWARNHKPVMAGLVVLVLTSVLSLAVASALLRREQARTETNFGLARDALVRLVRLASVPPKSKEVRKDIGGTALESSRTFLKSRPRDRGLRLDLAQTCRLVANIDRTVGEFEGPKKLYEEGADLLGALGADFPGDPAIVEEHALNSIDTGELWLMNGQPAKARVMFESVLNKVDALAGNLTDVQKRLRAIALLNLATALNEMDGSQRARELGIQAVELLTERDGEPIRKPDLSLLLAYTQVGLAELLLERPRESEDWFTRAVEQGEALINGEHDTPEVKHAFAVALRYRAERLAGDPKRSKQSVEDSNRAALLLHSLVEEHPHVPLYHRDMAISYIGLVDLTLVHADTTRDQVVEQLVKFNADAEQEIGTYAGSRNLFDYHRHLGRILAQRARIAILRKHQTDAHSLFDRALEEHKKALQLNSDSRIDRLMEMSVSQERDTLH
jgi:serine/threonine protein kinase